MKRERESVVGALTLVIGAALLVVTLSSVALVPAPPPADLSGWASDNRIALSIGNEVLFFAIVCLTPGVVVLHRATRVRHPLSSLVGCSSLVIGIALLAVLVPVGGRLVYPVFGIELSEDAMALVVSLFFAVLHAALMFWAVGLIAFGIALRRSGAGPWLAVAGILAGALQIAGAFPWLIPAWVSVVAAGAFGIWAAGAAWWLRSTPPYRSDL